MLQYEDYCLHNCATRAKSLSLKNPPVSYHTTHFEFVMALRIWDWSSHSHEKESTWVDSFTMFWDFVDIFPRNIWTINNSFLASKNTSRLLILPQELLCDNDIEIMIDLCSILSFTSFPVIVSNSHIFWSRDKAWKINMNHEEYQF